MQCKYCGKALGTNRGVCPFCGAMLTKDQIAEYRKIRENNKRAELLTEKYGEKHIYYEKRKEPNILGITIIFVTIILLLIIFIIITTIFHH